MRRRRRALDRGCGLRKLWHERLEVRRLLTIDLGLLIDLNTSSASEFGSHPIDFHQVGSSAYFMAITDTHGEELWRTDGTTEGTQLVKDFAVGYDFSSPNYLGTVNGVSLFSASTFETGWELFGSDGTQDGSFLVKDIQPGMDDSVPSDAVVLGDQLIFWSYDQDGNSQLWRSDGTEAGTQKIIDLEIGYDQYIDYNGPFAVLDGFAYFSASDGVKGYELWRTDGTTVGTTLVKDIAPDAADSWVTELVVLNSQLLFAATDPASGYELWSSDGTDSGTVKLKEIWPGTEGSDPLNFVVADQGVFFVAWDETAGSDVWLTDGTALGTQMVRDLDLGTPEIEGVLGNTIFFEINDGELWQSDGTSDNTFRVPDGGSDATLNYTDALEVVDQTVFFTSSASMGDELWKISGDSVVQIKDIYPGADGSAPSELTSFGSQLLFSADDGTSGEEPWISDGTPEGTRLLRDIEAGTHDGAYGFEAEIDDVALFIGVQPDTGGELWRTDGTVDGTQLVKDINPGPGSGSVNTIFVEEPFIYFRGDDGTTGSELWRSDGTEADTIRVTDLNPGSGGSFPNHMVRLGDYLYFAAEGDTVGNELWRLDPTSLEVTLVKDMSPGSADSFPGELTVLGNSLIFRARDTVSGTELWVSDGTSDGTQQVMDINPGVSSSSPVDLIQFGDQVVFRAATADSGSEIWRTDGTPAGTQLIKDIAPGGLSSHSTYFTPLGDWLYFRSSDGTNGLELWRTDATEAGTTLFADIIPGSEAGFPTDLTLLDDAILFFAEDLEHGQELWKTDGNTTWLVKDIRPGPVYSKEDYFYDQSIVDGLFYFVANDGVHGVELWRTDGSTEGTEMVDDITGDSGGLYVNGVAKLGNKLIVSGFEEQFGAELWIEQNLSPTEINLTPDTILENAASNTLIGTLSAVDPNPWDTVTLELTAGPGDDHNDLFMLDQDQLVALSPFDFEAGAARSIRAKATDSEGNILELPITINVLDANESPLGLESSSSSIDENSGPGTSVGTVSTNDPDAGDTFTYALVPGDGDTDNAAFQIVGDQLQSSQPFDFESQNEFQVRLSTTDSGGLALEQTLTITVNDVNEAPTALDPSGTSIDEGADAGTLVGTLSSADPDTGDTFTYALVPGDGDTDNAAFQIVGDQLQSNQPFDFESQNEFQVRLSTTDSGGLALEQTLTITVNDVNEAPTALDSSGTSIDENADAGALVGTLSTADPDAGDTFTYALVPGDGDTDNAAFQIVGDQLQSNQLFDFESQSEFKVRLSTTDSGTLAFEQTVTITVNDVNEAPTALDSSGTSIDENADAGTLVGTLSSADPDTGDTFTYALVAGDGDTDNAAFQIVGDQLQSNQPFDFESQNEFQVRLATTDSGGLAMEQALIITVNDIHEFEREDVNTDNAISPIDALLVINFLNSSTSSVITPETAHFDVNRDGFGSPIDALLVINYLNRLPNGEGEFGGTAAQISYSDLEVLPGGSELSAGVVDDIFDELEGKNRALLDWWRSVIATIRGYRGTSK